MIMRRQTQTSVNWAATFASILAIPMLSGCIIVNGQPCLMSCGGLGGPGCQECGPLLSELETPSPPFEELAQATIRPLHSRFHPVPTRPVFAPREEYFPPEPEGLVMRPLRPREALDFGHPMLLPTGESFEEFPVEEIMPVPNDVPMKILPTEDLPPLPANEPIDEIPAYALPESAQLLPGAEEDVQPDISASIGPVILDPSPQLSPADPEPENSTTDRENWRTRTLRR